MDDKTSGKWAGHGPGCLCEQAHAEVRRLVKARDGEDTADAIRRALVADEALAREIVDSVASWRQEGDSAFHAALKFLEEIAEDIQPVGIDLGGRR
jgi:hypothetical protein